MNRRELGRAIAAHLDKDVKEVEEFLGGFTDVVTAVVAKGEPVVMTGFAKFTKTHRPARTARNPATGEPVRVKAKTVAKATAMKSFKDAVMSPSTAPRLARGVWPTNPDLLARQAADRRSGGSGATPTKAAAKKATKKAIATKAAATKAVTKKATVKKAAAKRSASRTASSKRAPAKAPAKRKAASAKRSTARRVAR